MLSKNISIKNDNYVYEASLECFNASSKLILFVRIDFKICVLRLNILFFTIFRKFYLLHGQNKCEFVNVKILRKIKITKTSCIKIFGKNKDQIVNSSIKILRNDKDQYYQAMSL